MKRKHFKFWYQYKNQNNCKEYEKGWFEMDMSQSSVAAWEVQAKADDMRLEGWRVTFDDPFQIIKDQRRNDMSNYKWDNPYEWLEEASQQWSAGELRSEFLNMAQLIGFDSIQDIYQSDMIKDGYFDELEDNKLEDHE